MNKCSLWICEECNQFMHNIGAFYYCMNPECSDFDYSLSVLTGTRKNVLEQQKRKGDE